VAPPPGPPGEIVSLRSEPGGWAEPIGGTMKRVVHNPLQTELDGLLGDARARPVMAYRNLRWVRCSACGQKDKVRVSSARGFRLRDRVSPCCQARMRPLGWRPRSKTS